MKHFLFLLISLIFPWNVAIHANDLDYENKTIAIVGSDLPALWSAYFLVQEIEKAGLASQYEITLVGDNILPDYSRTYLEPMMVAGNIPSLYLENLTPKEIQEILTLQFHNQRLTQKFVSYFDEVRYRGNRIGSYLALEKEDLASQEFYKELFFQHKLPLTLCTEDAYPPSFPYTLFSSYSLYYVPFDSIMNKEQLKGLLLSYLLEERTDRPTIRFENTQCNSIRKNKEGDEDEYEITLELENGDLLWVTGCIVSLEDETSDLYTSLLPDFEYDNFSQLVINTEGFEIDQEGPYFMQIPSENMSFSFGKGFATFYQKFRDDFLDLQSQNGKSPWDKMQRLCLDSDDDDDFDFYWNTLCKPKNRFPYLYTSQITNYPLIMMANDQTETLSHGAAFGEMAALRLAKELGIKPLAN